MKRHRFTIILTIVAGMTVARAEPAGPLAINHGLAVRGYDVVAYFVDGQAVRGLAEHAVEWRGTRWQFSSKSNQDLFEQSPDRYAPRFGGFCALTIAHGALIPIDPEAWVIRERHLYLFFHEPARDTWLLNPDKLIKRAEARWLGANSKTIFSQPKD